MTPSGVLILDKPGGITSQTAVNGIRKIFNTKKAGHTGTLDPMATGVLTVLVGNAVKASELLVTEKKSYDAVLKLGITTDTEDITGSTLTEYGGKLPDLPALEAVLADFTGEIMQTPPMYSALKIDGKKLCDLARKGIEVERAARPINIYSLTAEKRPDKSEFLLHVFCSKGTYIRTLCADIGAKLGCGGCMAALRRTENGRFSLADAVSLDELRASDNPEKYIIPTEELFCDFREARLSPFYSKLARCGNEIYVKKIGVDTEIGEMFRLYDSDGVFFAAARAEEYESGIALKNVKMFL